MKAKLLSIFALMFFVSMNSWAQFYAPPGSGVTSVSLSPSSLTLTVGESTDVTASMTGAISLSYDWSVTGDEDCIQLFITGNVAKVTARKAGTATITASYSGKSATCTVTVSNPALTLSESTDNATNISTANGKVYDVTLTRTLQVGGWNTFCAPFSTATPSGWTVKELTSSAFNSATGELTLTFGAASSIEAGKPYLVKVDASVVNPTFDGVTISNTTTTTKTTAVDFVPVVNPTNLTGGDKTVLFITGGNKLTYPSGDGNINGFRAYFQLKGEARAQAPRAFRMSFDDDATGIVTVLSDEPTTGSGTYTIDGRRIEGEPTQKGVYIVNGKKTIIK